MVYLIARSLCYGGKIGRWHLCLDEAGEPLIFQTTEEAEVYIEQCPQFTHLNSKEYKREYQMLGLLNEWYIERDRMLVPRQ